MAGARSLPLPPQWEQGQVAGASRTAPKHGPSSSQLDRRKKRQAREKKRQMKQGSDDFWGHLLGKMSATEEANQSAQKAFADTAKNALELSTKVVQEAMQAREGASTLGIFLPSWAGAAEKIEREEELAELEKYVPMNPATAQFDYEACQEFAGGKIGNVFGSSFAHIDEFPTRVRLPTDRLLLCHRVMSITGDAKSLKPGEMVTEHDINSDAWYLDQGKIPTSIAIESVRQTSCFLHGLEQMIIPRV